jgi:hypothetical protein
MAVITNIDYVIKVMNQKSFPYWVVYDDKTKVNQNEDVKNVANSAKELRECIEALQGNYVEVSISSKNGDELKQGGDLKNTVLRYTIPCGGTSEAKNQPVQDNSNMIQLITENVSLKFQNQIESLKQQLAEYEDEDSLIGNVEQTPVEKLVDMLLPHAPAVIGKLFNIDIPPVRPTTLAGPGAVEEPTQTTTQTTTRTPEQILQIKKAAQAGNMLIQVDEFFGDRLLGLAILAKYDVNTYNMASGYLNNMLENLKTTNEDVKQFFANGK